MFKDIFNFAGIPIYLHDPTLKISSNWQMLDMFPEDIRNMCLVVIAQLLHDTYKYLVSFESNIEDQRSSLVEYLKTIISSHISQKLLDFVSGMHKIDISSFPSKVGSNFCSKLASLEFIKVVTHILGLDAEFEEEAQGIRKNLLKLVGYSNFSKETEFQEPCNSLVLPEVICHHCVYTRDIDFCRDPMLSHKIWKCFLCQADFNRLDFENKLVVLLQNKIKDFETQDLKCNKCRMNKGNLLSRYCACSGKYVPTRNKKEFLKFLETIFEVAKFHEFLYLQELVFPLLVN